MALAPEIVPLSLPPQEIIHLLYERSRDGCLIALHTRRDRADGSGEGYLPFTVLPIRERQAFLPFLGILPEQTKALSVNTFKRSAMKRGVMDQEYLRAIEDARPRFFFHRDPNVAELVAIFADLDVGKPHDDGHPPISAFDAALEVQRLAHNRVIPWPSMLALSGTGAYALWCLKSRSSDHPPKHTTQNAHRWRLIGDALHRTLGKALLYPDPLALNRLTQVMKAPGTIDTRTGNEVVFMVPYVPHPDTGRSTISLYTLDDLLGRLDLPTVDAPGRRHEIAGEIPPPPARESIIGVRSKRYALKPAKNPSPKDGGTSRAQAPFHARVRDLEIVAVSRGGFAQGVRHFACLHYYGAAWRFYGMKHPDAHRLACQKLADFNRRYCKPPLPPREIERMMSGKHLRTGYSKVMRHLKITDDEARRLDLKQLMPKADREARENVRLMRSFDLKARRGDVHRLIAGGRTNAEIYAELPGVDRSQVCRVRQALKIPDPSRKAHPSQAEIPAIAEQAPAEAKIPARSDAWIAERRRTLLEQAKRITGKA